MHELWGWSNDRNRRRDGNVPCAVEVVAKEVGLGVISCWEKKFKVPVSIDTSEALIYVIN